MSQFELHKKLIDDCEHLGKLSLSEVLLMKDERFPWLILVLDGEILFMNSEREIKVAFDSLAPVLISLSPSTIVRLLKGFEFIALPFPIPSVLSLGSLAIMSSIFSKKAEMQLEK